MRHARRSPLLLAALLVASAAAEAEEPAGAAGTPPRPVPTEVAATEAGPSGAAPLTYPAALDRAARVDERLPISDAGRAALAASRRENASRVRPTLDLAAGVATNNTAIDVQFGGPGAPPRTIQDTLEGDARLEARWSFLRPGHGREQEAFDSEIEAAGADRGAVEAAVRYEAATAYFDALAASARRRVAEADLARAASQLRLGRERLAAGEGSDLGVRQLDLAVRSLEAFLERMRVNEDLARERLRHLLALEASPDLPAAEEAGLPGRPSGLDLETLLSLAREKRFEIQASRGRAEAARARHAAAVVRKRPEAEATGTVAASTVEGFDGKTVDTRMEVGMRWTFFDAGARAAGAEREAESLRKAELELASTTRRVETEVRQALQGLRMALLQEEAAAFERDQAEAAHQQTESLYEAGAATEIDLAGRRADLAAASAALEAASVERVRAFVTLRFAVGTALPEGD